MKNGLDYLNAKAVLVIPRAAKAGFIVGGEYGEGVMRIRGKTVDYYSLAGVSVGFQFGMQERSIILVFAEEEALKKFRESSGWKVGADGSIVLAETGVSGFADTATANPFIIGHVFGQAGLMVNVSLEGAKFTRLEQISPVEGARGVNDRHEKTGDEAAAGRGCLSLFSACASQGPVLYPNDHLKTRRRGKIQARYSGV